MSLIDKYIIILSFLLSFGVSHFIWDTDSLSSLSFGHNEEIDTIFKLNVTRGNICIYNGIDVYWMSAENPFNYSIAFALDSVSSGYMRAPLNDIHFTTVELKQNPSKDKIYCAVSEDDCSVTIDKVYLNLDVKRMVIQFSKETNEPILLTSKLITGALNIEPPLFGQAVGSWKSPSELELSLSVEYIDYIVDRHNKGLSLRVDVSAPKRQEHRGRFVLHPSQLGHYSIFVVDGLTSQVVSQVHRFSVVKCGSASLSTYTVQTRGDIIPSHGVDAIDESTVDESLLPIISDSHIKTRLQAKLKNLSLAFGSAKPSTTPRPGPLLRYRGVIPVGGRNPILIPDSSIVPADVSLFLITRITCHYDNVR
jgi:hypothetical protein